MKEEVEEKSADTWIDGYNKGYQTALKENKEKIGIGEAILKVLDERYEFKNEYGEQTI